MSSRRRGAALQSLDGEQLLFSLRPRARLTVAEPAPSRDGTPACPRSSFRSQIVPSAHGTTFRPNGIPHSRLHLSRHARLDRASVSSFAVTGSNCRLSILSRPNFSPKSPNSLLDRTLRPPIILSRPKWLILSKHSIRHSRLDRDLSEAKAATQGSESQSLATILHRVSCS